MATHGFCLWSLFLIIVPFCLQVTISGYAVSGGGRGIERVDVSVDGGKSWIEASRYQKPDIPYIPDDANSDRWAWVFFKAESEILHNAEIVAKAVNSLALYLQLALLIRGQTPLSHIIKA